MRKLEQLSKVRINHTSHFMHPRIQHQQQVMCTHLLRPTTHHRMEDTVYLFAAFFLQRDSLSVQFYVTYQTCVPGQPLVYFPGPKPLSQPRPNSCAVETRLVAIISYYSRSIRLQRTQQCHPAENRTGTAACGYVHTEAQCYDVWPNRWNSACPVDAAALVSAFIASGDPRVTPAPVPNLLEGVAHAEAISPEATAWDARQEYGCAGGPPIGLRWPRHSRPTDIHLHPAAVARQPSLP